MSNQLASSRFRSSSRPLQHGIVPPEIDQLGAAVDEKLDPFGQRIELAQQGDARRLQRGAQRPLGGGALAGSGGLDQCLAAAVDLVVVDIEFAGEQLQKALAPGGVQRQIGAAEIGGASPRGDLAAAPVEAAQHLLTQPARRPRRKVGPRRAGQHAARRLGDLAPRAAQIGQRPVEDAFEETGGSGIGHGGSGGSGLRRTRRERGPDVNPKNAGAQISVRRPRSAKQLEAPAESPRSRSSATSPGPNRRAASPCIQTAAAAAANGSMPCARSPSTIPARTSPLPAVASSGGAFALIATRPSGAAMTVSAPFSRITAPLSRAARRARSGLLPAGVEQAGKLALMRASSRKASGSPRTTSRDRRRTRSAHRHRARRASRPRGSPVPCRGSRSPTPAPGPISTALRRLSASSARKSSRPATGWTMTPVNAAA